MVNFLIFCVISSHKLQQPGGRERRWPGEDETGEAEYFRAAQKRDVLQRRQQACRRGCQRPAGRASMCLDQRMALARLKS
jgi:hypothetical protein